MKKLLAKLISFKTVTENKKESVSALNWVKEQVKDLPVFVTSYTSNGYPSLVITTQKTKKPKLLLAAHIDVVPGSSAMFKPVIKGGKMYGRGVFDMKYSIACYLKLFQELGDDLKNHDLGIMITADEEIGGFNGVDSLLKKGYKPEVCFLPDSGKNWIFENEAKGVWHLTVESTGKSAHGSVPWQGKNAIENLMDYLNVLRDSFFCQGKQCKLPEHYHETLNIGKIQGGKATNMVPDSAFANIDIRFTPRLSKEKINKILNNAKKGFSGIKVKEIVFADSFKLDPNNQYLKLFKKLAEKKIKKEIPITFSHGSTDARFFMYKNIPTLVISPNGGNHHGEGEWVDLKDMEKFKSILKEFIEKVA